MPTSSDSKSAVERAHTDTHIGQHIAFTHKWVRPRSSVAATERNMYEARTLPARVLCVLGWELNHMIWLLRLTCVLFVWRNLISGQCDRQATTSLVSTVYSTDTNAHFYHCNHDNKYLFNKHTSILAVCINVAQSMPNRTDRDAERYMHRTFGAINK